jgi:hypothetical protein
MAAFKNILRKIYWRAVAFISEMQIRGAIGQHKERMRKRREYSEQCLMAKFLASMVRRYGAKETARILKFAGKKLK